MKEISINVPKDYTKPTTVAVNGECGPGCKDLTAKIETALGSIEKSENTAEFDMQPNVIEQTEQQKAGH